MGVGHMVGEVENGIVVEIHTLFVLQGRTCWEECLRSKVQVDEIHVQMNFQYKDIN